MGLSRWIERLKKLSEQADEAVRMEKHNKRVIQRVIKKEFQRRDIWALRDAEVQRLAHGRKIWVIKCPAPDTKEKYQWGDYAYCMSLKSVIERMGYYVVMECHEDWYEPVQADVVLVMRGRHDYHPDRRNEKCRYLMWMVCHPDMVPDEEYELYDHIYVDSHLLAEKLQKKVHVPVSSLIVGADVRKFHPADAAQEFPENELENKQAAEAENARVAEEAQAQHDENPQKYGLVFVGNTRGEKRNSAVWCEKYHIPLDIWGVGWEKFYPSDTKYLHFHGQMPYEELPELYRNSTVILNDHYEAMRETGMVNNRMIEASACGCPIVSDYSPEYEKIPGKIVFYHGEEDFAAAVRNALDHAADWRREAEKKFPDLCGSYSMDACIRRMISDMKSSDV